MAHNPRPVLGEDPWGAKFNAWIDEALSEKMPTAGPVLFPDKTSTSNIALRAPAGDAVVFVSTTGNDANDGLSWGTAKATLQAAHDALPSSGGTVRVGGGTWTVTTRTNVTKAVIWQGMGRDVTVLLGGVNSDYQFLRQGTTDLAGVEFRDLTLDLGGGTLRSGIRVEYVSRFAVRRCRFRNVTAWGLVVGVMLGSDSVIRNADVTIEDCDFDTISGTMEQLLLFNSRDVVVRDCRFSGISSSSYGIGLYQNLDGVVVDNAHFTGAGTGLYYSLSTDNIVVVNSRFLCGTGVQGANQSDNGAFGAPAVRGLTVRDCLFTTTAASYGLQIGAVRDAAVVGCVFYRCQEIGLLIDDGNSPVTVVPRNVAVIGCRFRDTNQANTAASLHPGIFVATGANAPELGLLVTGCTFDDQQATQTQLIPMTFYGAFSYDKVRIVGNRIKAGAGGVPVALIDGATLGTSVDIWGNIDWITGGATENVRIGGTGSKIGFFGVTPVVRPAANADTSGATLTQLETEVNEIKATLRSLGLLT